MRLWLLLLWFGLPSFAAQKNELKYPIVLIRGGAMGPAPLLFYPDNFGNYFQRIPEFLSRLGAKVYVPSLRSEASFQDRAEELAEFIHKNIKAEKINIVAHSSGGLDARFLASQLRFEGIASITTIATPHHGTPLANYAEEGSGSARIWFHLFKLFGFNGKGRRTIRPMTVKFMEEEFNPKVLDRDDISYFSVLAHGDPWWWNLSPVLWGSYFYARYGDGTDSGLKSDGLVPIPSQVWGQVIAVVPLDHLAQINHHLLRFPMEDQSLALYRKIYDNLLLNGF